MPRRRLVHLFLEHSLVDRADGVLRPAEDLRAHAFGLTERELRDGVADPAFDTFGSERDLVVAVAFAPLLRAVRIADRHAHDRDRCVDAAERHHARDATAGTHDHLAAYLFPKNPVGRPDVARPLRCDSGRLQPEPVLADRGSRLIDDAIARRATPVEGKVEPNETELDADHLGCEGAKCLLEQLLTSLVAFENDDGLHGAQSYSRIDGQNAPRKVPLRFAACFSRLPYLLESRPKERMHGTKDDPRM